MFHLFVSVYLFLFSFHFGTTPLTLTGSPLAARLAMLTRSIRLTATEIFVTTSGAPYNCTVKLDRCHFKLSVPTRLPGLEVLNPLWNTFFKSRLSQVVVFHPEFWHNIVWVCGLLKFFGLYGINYCFQAVAQIWRAGEQTRHSHSRISLHSPTVLRTLDTVDLHPAKALRWKIMKVTLMV